VADWIKNDQTGSADLYYLSLNPPYRAAQRYLTDISELARIKDSMKTSSVRSLPTSRRLASQPRSM